MKLFCLVLVVGFVAGSAPKSSYGNLDIYLLTQWTEALESDMQYLAKNISDATTLSAVIDDEINEINDFFIAAITTENEQQSDLIASYKAQVKALQLRVDDALALSTQATTLATATKASVAEQINDYVAGPKVAGVNKAQQVAINQLAADIAAAKQEFLSNLATTITALETSEAKVEGKIAVLNDFVASRKCEYGSGILSEGVTTVYLKTKFTTPPKVTLSLTGFVAHLDNYEHAYDILSLAKVVTADGTDYFTVAAYDNSEGQVDVTYVSCSWMACQNLDKDVVLKH